MNELALMTSMAPAPLAPVLRVIWCARAYRDLPGVYDALIHFAPGLQRSEVSP